MIGTVFISHITISNLLNDLFLIDIYNRYFIISIIDISAYVAVYEVSPVKS